MDDIDTGILKSLHANGWQKHNELARQLNIAQPTGSDIIFSEIKTDGGLRIKASSNSKKAGE